MWKIFSKKEANIESFLFSIDKWKIDIFTLLEIEVKEYFAKKVVVYFDNNMIYQNKRGLHINLMDALSTSEKEMLNIQGVFGRIELYWIRDEDNHTLVVFGLNDDKEYTLINNGFKLIKRDAVPLSNKLEEFERSAWKTLIFDVELVNYASGWINYTPDMEERSFLQTKYILLQTYLKNNESTLLETLNYEENIKGHKLYDELYNRVLRVMPKIENSLEQEWRTGSFINVTNKSKKNKV